MMISIRNHLHQSSPKCLVHVTSSVVYDTLYVAALYSTFFPLEFNKLSCFWSWASRPLL